MAEIGLENWEAQIRKGWLDVAILAILWQGRLYGLEILRELESRSDLVLAEGTVYPVLTRLRKEGLIEGKWEESDSGHPRRYYKLTSAGKSRAQALARHSHEFLAKIDALIQPLLKEQMR
ncbi:MAG TPA: PadR family transcriptional regulator [Steroidobacteraceae bacterium]|nr:PadR family transcriptional regulator [Steroidobacteraceae bacterium]